MLSCSKGQLPVERGSLYITKSEECVLGSKINQNSRFFKVGRVNDGLILNLESEMERFIFVFYDKWL